MALALAAWVWVVGSAIAPARPPVERVAFGIIGACALAWAAMGAGAVGVGLFGNALAPAAIALIVAVGGVAWRRPSLSVGRPSLVPIAVGVAAAALVSAPGLRLSLDELRPSRGDMAWHTGWADQLLAGFSSPGGVYAGVPNSYPWLYHALVAWIAAALPGGLDDAISVLQAFSLVAAGVGMWLLARALAARPAAATWSIGFFVAGGAFSWLPHSHLDLKFQMSVLQLGPFDGTPVPAMNPGLAFLAPVVPRDLGLALSPLVLWAALDAVEGRGAGWWLVGFLGGMVFLVAPPAGIFCALWVAAIAAINRRAACWRAFVAAAATTAVWLVPLALAYRRYHGFVPTTMIRLVEPSAGEVIAAVGLALPLGAAGLALIVRRRGPRAKEAVALVVIPVLAVLAAATAAHTGSLLQDGIPVPLVRWLRYLPFVVLALCVPAGIAADALVGAVRRRLRPAALVTAAVIAAAAVGSTVLASASEWRDPASTAPVCSTFPADARTLVAVAGPEPFADRIARSIFSATGASVYYMGAGPARVRFRDWAALQKPSLPARRRALHRLAHGGPVPPGVDLLVLYRNSRAKPRPAAVGTCHWKRTVWDLVPVHRA